jgi:hypothetical protein
MKLKERTLVDLGSNVTKDLLGHISTYEKKNGNEYYVYFVEARYFGFKEVDLRGNIIKEGRTEKEYHYLIDTFFNRLERRLGWSF